jgi:hypothetical protein
MTLHTSSRLARTLAGAGLLLTFSASFAQYKGAIPPPVEFEKGFHAITTDLAKSHLNYLAGPECAGRGSGQPGYQKAADYVAARFKELGLVPIGDNGTYFQGVPFQSVAIDTEATVLTGPMGELKVGRGLGVSGTTDAAVSSEAIVFLSVKAGTALPETLDLTGKTVILNTDNFDQTMRNAIGRKGAALVLHVVQQATKPMPSITRGQGGGNRGGNRSSRVYGEIERRYALDAARNAGVDVALLGAPNADLQFKEAASKVSFTLKVKSEEIRVPNVVGMLPGSDPTLKEQYIGVGAHLDHEGVRNGVVYPGADDDASGSTAMLMVAKALAENPTKPKRTVVFMAFCAEEMGLIGSRYYTENPLIPLEKMVCLLQMDMVGRNEETETDKPEDNVDTIHLVGSKRISTELHTITIDMNKHIGFTFEYDEEGVYERSDHANFARKGVPITFLFSGFHPDYHRPTDTADKINFDKIVSAARLNYLVLQKVAGLPEMVKRDVGG